MNCGIKVNLGITFIILLFHIKYEKLIFIFGFRSCVRKDFHLKQMLLFLTCY